jgi:uncharacterized membrane-anchored protein YhcB (DUF1043 family)
MSHAEFQVVTSAVVVIALFLFVGIAYTIDELTKKKIEKIKDLELELKQLKGEL